MKKRWIAAGIAMIMLSGLCGCADSASDGKQTAAEDALQDESYQEWVQDDSLSEDEKKAREWNSQCESLKASLGAIEGISGIEISPSDYDTYVADGSATVTCTLSRTAEPELEGEIKAFIDSTNMFDKYEMEFK